MDLGSLMYIFSKISLWSFQRYKIHENIPALNDLNHGQNWEKEVAFCQRHAYAAVPLSVSDMPIFAHK